MTERPDVAAFLAFLNNLPGPRTHEVTPVVAREQFAMMRHVADVELGTLAVVRDLVVPSDAGSIPARVFDVRAQREPGPVLVFYHGGGFVIGNLDTHEAFCAEAARVLDVPVIAIDYRLAPEAPFPAALDDCEVATRWIASAPAELGYTPTGLVLSGDSAGGAITIVTAMALRDAPAAVPVLVQAPMYPVVGARSDWASFAEHGEGKLLTNDTMRWFGEHYAAESGHRRAEPIEFDQAGMPSTVLVTAGLDPLRDQGRAYAGKLIEAGVPVVFREAVGNIHGFATLRKAIPSTQRDVAGFLAAVKSALADAVAALNPKADT